MAAHRVAKTLQAGGAAFGCWLATPGVLLAHTIASATPHLDFILIDCEHGLIPLHGGAAESILAIARASVTPPSTFVRIPGVDEASRSWQLKYALDAGANGVIVPMVGTAAEAASVARWSRFPPLGSRGFGSQTAYLGWPGVDKNSYAATANTDVVVGVQIETLEGFENVKAIAEVPGVDLLFIGPFDLSAALGEPRPYPAPSARMEVAFEEILKAAHTAGKKAGILAFTPEDAKRRAAQGFDFITVTSETGALTSALSKAFSECR